MGVTIFLIAAVVLILVWLLLKRPKPIYHKNISRQELRRFIQGLQEVGADGSLLIIEDQDSERFIQFAKYIESMERKNLHFGFPDAPWSSAFFEGLKKELDAQGFKYHVRNVASDNFNGVKRFLEIDYIPDVDAAFKIAGIALSSMGLQETAKFTVHYEGSVDHRENKKYIHKQMAIKKKGA